MPEATAGERFASIGLPLASGGLAPRQTHWTILMAPLQKLALVALVSLSAGPLPALGAQNDPRDVAAIRDVVEAFRTSIINKDREGFLRLFYSDNPERVTWQMVDDDARVARFKEFAPEASRVVWWPENNFVTTTISNHDQ